jgi:hypothetical protein
MKLKSPISRRRFTIKFFLLSAVVLSTDILLGSCGRKNTEEEVKSNPPASADPCSDLSGVSENDLELRKKFAYVKQSPIADNQCNNCNLYLPAKEDIPCGGCMLFKGPVSPSGYCAYWAPIV